MPNLTTTWRLTTIDDRVSATVYRLMKDKGYGFVRLQDGREVFLHRSAFELGASFDALDLGERITCRLTTSAKGLRAEQAQLWL